MQTMKKMKKKLLSISLMSRKAKDEVSFWLNESWARLNKVSDTRKGISMFAYIFVTFNLPPLPLRKTFALRENTLLSSFHLHGS